MFNVLDQLINQQDKYLKTCYKVIMHVSVELLHHFNKHMQAKLLYKGQ